MSAGRTIELGERPHGDEPEPPSGPPRPPGRPLRAALLFVVVLLTATGSVPAPARPRYVAVPAPQGAAFLIDGDRLVVADGPSNVGEGGRLVAGYRLPGGEPLWRLSLPAGDHVLGVGKVAGTLLVASSPAGAGDPSSWAVDIDTGTVRWKQPGYAVPTQDGGVLFEAPRPDGTGTLRSVDLASGAQRWSLPMPSNGVAYQFGDQGVERIVMIAASGRVEIRDPGSGALLRVGRVPPAADGVSYRFTQVVGDLLLVDRAPGTVTAYGLDRLDRRWTVPVDARSAAWFQPCGDVLCLRARETDLRVIDPVTGRTRWTTDRWAAVFPVDGRLLAAAGAGIETELVVLDPATGRVVSELGRWRLAGSELTDRPLLGLGRLPGDRQLVAELDVAAGEARIRAVLPGSGGECGSRSGVLVCLPPAGGLVVWRLDG